MVVIAPTAVDPCALMASGYVEGKNEQHYMDTGYYLSCDVQEALYQNYLTTCQGGQEQ